MKRQWQTTLLILVVGCGSVNVDHEPDGAAGGGAGGGQTGGSGGSAGATMAAGTSGSSLGGGSGSSAGGTGGSMSGVSADDFAGTWTYMTGDLVPSHCSVLGVAIPTLVVVGNTLNVVATDATHLSASAGAMCTLNFTVSGSIATAAAGQMCVISVNGVNVTLNVSSYTLTLASGMLTSSESGSAPIGGSSCTISGNGQLSWSGQAALPDAGRDSQTSGPPPMECDGAAKCINSQTLVVQCPPCP